MNVIFFTSNEGFPVKKDGMIFIPRPCIGGFIFQDSPEKREVCDDLGLEYEIKDLSDIEFPPPPLDPIDDES